MAHIHFGMPKSGEQMSFHQILLSPIYSMTLFFHSMHLNLLLVFDSQILEAMVE